ncbi:hypothetical protein QR685DRAFT_450509 [Neurospora intermedia]|uniref:Uncharacterized protein n=1 Tax=Neurospora intermedia TaxID=5142 RepID=A0ABR3D439_NEUIN
MVEFRGPCLVFVRYVGQVAAITNRMLQKSNCQAFRVATRRGGGGGGGGGGGDETRRYLSSVDHLLFSSTNAAQGDSPS